jgi:hypothetical protein
MHAEIVATWNVQNTVTSSPKGFGNGAARLQDEFCLSRRGVAMAISSLLAIQLK